MPQFKTVGPIQLGFTRVRNGVLITGLSVTVKVFNSITGVALLTSTALTETTPGIYSYSWAHALTAQTDCMAIYTVGGLSYVENFQVDESLDKNEQLSGRAN